jgi:AcrR family transcriptional regulator
MSDTRPARRRYDNAGRAAQAAANRAAVMRAAVEVLADRGYSGATMTAIASAAGVSVETVYKGFGTKSELVRQVLGAAVVGDDQPVALVDRPEMRAARSEATGAAILAAFAEVSMGILARVGPLLATVLASGRAGEPELRAIARHAGLQRLADLRRVVESVAATGDLRVDLDVDQATDILWTVGSPEVYLQLTVDRGWTGTAYHDWLSRTLALLLLA